MNYKQESLLHHLKLLSSDQESRAIESQRYHWQRRYLIFFKIESHSVRFSNQEILKRLQSESASRIVKPAFMRFRSRRLAFSVAALVIFAVGVPLLNQRGSDFLLSPVRSIHISRAITAVTPGLLYGEISRNSNTIRINRDTIKMRDESLDTDFATNIRATSAEIKFEEFRDGIGIRLSRGEVLFTFHPGTQTRRYIIFPENEVVTITGTQVYAKIDQATKQTYLRHGKATLESPYRGTVILNSSKMYMLGSSITLPLTPEADQELSSRFGLTSLIHHASPVVRKEKKRTEISYASWLEDIEEGTETELMDLLREFRYVYKVFLPGSRSAYLGQNKADSSLLFSADHQIRIPAEVWHMRVRLK